MLELMKSERDRAYVTFSERAEEKTWRKKWTLLGGILLVAGLVAIMASSKTQPKAEVKSAVEAGGDTCPPLLVPVGTTVRLENQDKKGEFITTCVTHPDWAIYAYLSAAAPDDKESQFILREGQGMYSCMYSFESVAHPGYYLGFYGKCDNLYLQKPSVTNCPDCVGFRIETGKSGSGISIKNVGGCYFGISPHVGTAPACPSTKVATVSALPPPLATTISWNIVPDCGDFEIPKGTTCGSPIVVPQSLDDLKTHAANCQKNDCLFIRGELMNYDSQCSCIVSPDGLTVEVKTVWGTSPRTRTYSGSVGTAEAEYRHTDLTIYQKALTSMTLPPNVDANQFYFAVVGQQRNLPAQMTFKAVDQYSVLSGMLRNGYCPPFELSAGGVTKSFLTNEFICRLWSGSSPYAFLVGYQTITGQPGKRFGFKVTFRPDASGVSLGCAYYKIDAPPVLLSNGNHKWYNPTYASNGDAMSITTYASSYVPSGFTCSKANVLVKY